jgi:hypothetical protein
LTTTRTGKPGRIVRVGWTYELLAGLIDRVLAFTLQGPDEIAFIAVRAKLRADAEQGRESRRLKKIAPMIIDAILEAWPLEPLRSAGAAR